MKNKTYFRSWGFCFINLFPVIRAMEQLIFETKPLLTVLIEAAVFLVVANAVFYLLMRLLNSRKG